ncbi:MAG: transporter substrate-binding domain-containing protein [Oleiphilaceae bacterium]|nr:transporter substrate-binding domain-containing protein [Oleiphilaceae bacterium]
MRSCKRGRKGGQRLLCLLVAICLPALCWSDAFIVHCRERVPELIPVEDGCIGPVPDLIQRAMDRLGVTFRWQHIPWKRSLELARIGQVDLLPRHSMTEERSRFLMAINYGTQVREIIYFLAPHQTNKVEQFSDLKALRVGALSGSFYSHEFNNALELNKTFVNRTEQLLDMLMAGRLDVAVTSASHELDLFEATPLLRRAKYVERFENARYISIPKNSRLANRYVDLVKVIGDMRRSGEIKAIYEQYGLGMEDQLLTHSHSK